MGQATAIKGGKVFVLLGNDPVVYKIPAVLLRAALHLKRILKRLQFLTVTTRIRNTG